VRRLAFFESAARDIPVLKQAKAEYTNLQCDDRTALLDDRENDDGGKK